MSDNIPIVENILNANDLLAEQIHEQLNEAGVLALNFMASPGGGKTSVITQTVKALMDDVRIGVMDGDIVAIDLRELAEMGIPVSLINTGGQCHLDANMVHNALPSMDLKALDLLIIENVGNLICPAAFKLGVHKVTTSHTNTHPCSGALTFYCLTKWTFRNTWTLTWNTFARVLKY